MGPKARDAVAEGFLALLDEARLTRAALDHTSATLACVAARLGITEEDVADAKRRIRAAERALTALELRQYAHGNGNGNAE